MASLLNMSGGSLLGKGLPYDAEIEYLESSGGSYINTGILINTEWEYECKFSTTANLGGSLFGTRETNVHKGLYFTWGTWGCYVIYGNVSYTGFTRFYLQENTQYVFVAKEHDATINSVSVLSGVWQGDTIERRPLYIFGANNGGTPESYGNIRISQFTINDKNNAIIDLIPVRIGTTGYMYDKVSGQLFGNSGTGDFILGNDI